MKFKIHLIAAVSGLCLAGAALTALSAPAYLEAAVADAHRPDADKARDAARKPAEVLAFAGVKPGFKVLELLPGRGYFTRVFSLAVGPQGRVYVASSGMTPAGKPVSINPLQGDPTFANTVPVQLDLKPFKPFNAPELVDVVFTAENYHDLHLHELGLDIAAFDRAVFAALKPGGVFIIEDHAAQAGSALRDPDRLHRIDEAVVKAEAAQAGFVLDGESDILRNPADDRTLIIFDPAIRGHTDQFLLKFRKPLN